MDLFWGSVTEILTNSINPSILKGVCPMNSFKYFFFVFCLTAFQNPLSFAQADTLTRLWGTYYGGSNGDGISSTAIDAYGNVFVCGTTTSADPNVIATNGSHQPNLAGGSDAFIVKFNSAGVRIWGTYYGGTGNDDADDLVVDYNGDIIIVGGTRSTSGIATAGSHQTIYGGGDSYMGDGFIVKFDSAGTRIWGTYYGGSTHDVCPSVSIDNDNSIIVGGITDSPNNIATTGSHQQTTGGSYDTFLAKFTSTGVRLWGSYYGGSSYDWGGWIVVDSNNNIVLEGCTQGSIGVISTPGSHQQNYGGGSFDHFIVKFNSAGIRQWGTYYGGTGGDYDGYGLTIDQLNNIYFTGNTDSPNAIATAGSHQSSFGGNRDGYLVKFDSAGVRQWGTYYGGTGVEVIGTTGGVTQPVISAIYLYGTTNSTNNIASSNAYQLSLAGENDTFIAKFDANGLRLWGTYYGGSGNDVASQLTFTSAGTINVAGSTTSTNVIGVGGFQSTYGGGTGDGFIAKFSNIVTDVEESLNDNPIVFTLIQNYPNPLNPSTTIKYQIPEMSFVTLKVYDVLGNEIAALVNEEKPIGSYVVEFNAATLPSGVYFYQLKAMPNGGQAGGYLETKKMILLK